MVVPAPCTIEALPTGLAPPDAERLAMWLESSRRFAAFAAANRDKIRKKLRGASTEESARDVLARLAVAFLLLEERRVELAYESFAARGAGPDFAVRFRAGEAFHAEVTRLRVGADQGKAEQRLATRICAKLRQLAPGARNVLVVVTDSDAGSSCGTGTDDSHECAVGGCAAAPSPGRAVGRLTARVEARDDAFFERSGLGGRKDFIRLLGRLRGVLVLTDAIALCERDDRWDVTLAPAGMQGHVWEHKNARHPLTRELLNVLCRAAGQVWKGD